MSSSPLITIVLPARNRATLLPRTLDSIAEQTLRPLRVILVDNGSTDATRSLMEDWRRNVAGDIDVEVLEHMEPGACGARNAGLDIVTSPWVMFFDSDDEMLPHHCEDFARAIEANPQADMVGRTVKAVTLAGNVRLRKFETENALFNHIFHGILATQRYIVKTSFARKAGGWNPEAKSWNDYEFGLRLLMLNPVMVKLPGAPSVFVYSQKRSITGTSFSRCPENWERSLDLCRDTLRRYGREDLMPWIEVRAAILAACYRCEGDRDNSRRLLAATLASSPQWRGRLRLLYLQNKLMHHGTGRIARYLFPHADGRMHSYRAAASGLTIVLPARNRGRLLPRTLDSIAAQTLRPLKVVLVDNGSTDNTRNVMEKWRSQIAGDIDVEVIEHTEPGAAGARNAGLERVTSPWVMFFDSDDEMLPTHCEEFMRAIEANPHADIVGRNVKEISLDGKTCPRQFEVRNALYNHIFHGILATLRYAVRTSFIRKVGAWNPEVKAWDDYELGLRMLMHHPVMVKIDGAPSAVVHRHGESITGLSFSRNPEIWERSLDLCRDTLRRHGREDLMPWIESRAAILAACYRREGDRDNSRRLLASTLASSPQWRGRLRLLYLQNRLMHHGTGRIARYLFPHVDGRMYPTRGGSALLTIVVHSRNGAACLPETLVSIQRQTLRPLRVVLVDNDSTDATPEFMRNWKQLTDGDLEVEIVSEKRHGDAAARNAGLECVETPYVMFLDSGEMIQPHSCAVIADAATGNSDADLFCRKRLSLSRYPERRRPFAVRTSLIRKIGGWNVKAWGWESYELEVRLWLSQPKTVAVGKKCAVIPSENAGLLKSTLLSNSPMKWEGTLDICEECMNKAGRDDAVIWANVQRMILAARYLREGARSEGRRLAEQTIARSRAGLRLRLLLFHHRIFGRGTLRMARILFPSASHV